MGDRLALTPAGKVLMKTTPLPFRWRQAEPTRPQSDQVFVWVELTDSLHDETGQGTTLFFLYPTRLVLSICMCCFPYTPYGLPVLGLGTGVEVFDPKHLLSAHWGQQAQRERAYTR